MSVQYEPKHTEQCRISTEDHKCTCGLEAYLQDVAKGKEAVETMGQIKRLAELHLEGSLMMLALADPDMTKQAHGGIQRRVEGARVFQEPWELRSPCG